jgi:pyrimidine-specific ribonucleoside hydrolase
MAPIYLKTSLPFAFLFFSIFLFNACGVSSSTGLNRMGAPERSVIIDTDLAFDDRIAILFVLKRQELSVKAITVSAGGEDDCKPKIQDVQALLGLTQHESLPAACSSTPGLFKNAPNQQAVNLLTSVLQLSPQKITILALGPLTNIAAALRKTPSLIKKIEGIYIMGGAVQVPGNVMKPDEGINNPVAEWNFYADPEAANQVLRAKVPITLIPLDVTNQVPVTDEFIEQLKILPQNRQTSYVLNLLTNQPKSMAYRLFFWDPLAAAIFRDETLAGFEKRPIRVIERNGPKRGQVVIDPAGPEVRVAFRVDTHRFEKIFFDTIAPLTFGPLN